MPTGPITPAPADISGVSFFSGVFRDSAVPSIIIGFDGTVLFWNSASERLFGWSSEEVLGRPLPSVPRDRMDEHMRLRQRTLKMARGSRSNA